MFGCLFFKIVSYSDNVSIFPIKFNHLLNRHDNVNCCLEENFRFSDLYSLLL